MTYKLFRKESSMTTSTKTHQPDDVSFGQVFQLMITNAIPVYCLLREMVQNGYDANLRYAEECLAKQPELYRPETSRVLVTRWKLNEDKLAVINVNGAFLTPTEVKENLMNVSRSGNTGDLNFGIGVKYACFKHFHHIEFRSKKANSDVGKCYKIDGSPTGQGKWDEIDIPLEAFTELGYEDSGTEVIVMGTTPGEKTYDLMHDQYRTYKGEGHTGNNFFKYLCGRYFESFTDSAGNPIKLQVNVYPKGSRTKNPITKTCNSDFVRNIMALDDDEWTAFDPFPLTSGPYAGAMVYVSTMPNDEGKKKRTNVRTRGSLVLQKQNEIYDKFSPGTEYDDGRKVKPYLRECGLKGLHEKQVMKWLFRVDFDSFDSIKPKGDRLTLIDEANLNKEIDLTVLAGDIAASLSEQVKKRIAADSIPPEDFDDELEKEQKKYIEFFNVDHSGGGSRAGKKNKGSNARGNKGNRKTAQTDPTGNNPHKPYRLQPFAVQKRSDGPLGVLRQIDKDPITGKTVIYYNVESKYNSLALRSLMGEVERLSVRSETLKDAIDNLSMAQKAQACWDAIKREVALSTIRKFMQERKVTGLTGEEVIKRLTPAVLGYDIDPTTVGKTTADRMRYYHAQGIGLKP
jgi:hypothetical protein